MHSACAAALYNPGAHELRRLVSDRPFVRVIEAHSPFAAIIASRADLATEGSDARFDALWSSSLTDSLARGCPDTEYVSIRERLHTVSEIRGVCSLPVIMDADSGGMSEHFVLNVKAAEDAGVAALIVEDKVGLKKNSLLGTEANQTQATIADFSAKIRLGKAAKRSADTMLIARVESLILEAGMADAVTRSLHYVEAGADAIMMHSRHKSAAEVFEFSKIFLRECPGVPLVCVPTSFNQVTAEELADNGYKIIIYANQLMRSSYAAMAATAHSILKHGRALEAEPFCLPIDGTLNLIEGNR